MKILVTLPEGEIRDSFLPHYVCQRLSAMGEVTYNETGRNYTSEDLNALLKGFDVVVTGWGAPCFNAHALENADCLKAIVHTGGAVASLVSKELYEKGVKLLSGNIMYAESVAEGVVGYALASLRAIPYYSDQMRRGAWYGPRGFQSRGLLDARVNLIGLGAIPGYLCGMLKPFRCKIKAFDKYAPQERFDELGVERLETLEECFSPCDILSLHLPINTQTNGLITADLLSKIPDGTLFINTARGAVIDEAALAEELKKGRFTAVLDVYKKEPLPVESPLRSLENVILMPHMAGPTFDRRPKITMALLDELEKPWENASPFEIGYEYAMRMTNE